MKRKILSFIALFSFIFCSSQTKTLTVNGIFNQPYFIENKGQCCVSKNHKKQDVLFSCIQKGLRFYFFKDGFSVLTPKKQHHAHKNEKEMLFDEQNVDEKSIDQTYHELFFKFKKASKNVNVLSEIELPLNFFFQQYLKPESNKIESKAYKSITYEKIYKNIDIKFSFNKKGELIIDYLFKSNSKLTDIDFEITNDNEKQLFNQSEDNIIKTPLGSVKFLTEKENSGNSKQTVQAVISNTIVYPNLPGGSGVYDIDYDKYGNIYVYGGYYFTFQKYDAAGNLLWTYQPFIDNEGMYGDFAIDRINDRIYIIEGIYTTNNKGARILKLDLNGNNIATFTGKENCRELWRIGFDPCTNKGVVAAGGEGAGSINPVGHTFTLDTSLLTLTPITLSSSSGKVLDANCLAFDEYQNCYQVFCKNQPATNNILFKLPLSNISTQLYDTPLAMNILEYSSINYYSQPAWSNGYNGISTSNTKVFTYNGTTLQKWNSNGQLIKNLKMGPPPNNDSTIIFWGGLASNICEQVLLGRIYSVKHYDSTLNLIQSYTMPGFIYDIVWKTDGTVYVSGDDFLSVLYIPNKCINITKSVSQPTSCSSFGSASIQISGGTVPYNISWNSLPVQTGSTAVNLSPSTIYTVSVNDNACNTNYATDTIVMINPGPFSLSLIVKPESCAKLKDGSIVISPIGGNGPFFYNWSTGISSMNANQLTGLSHGTYSLLVTDNLNCTYSTSINVDEANNILFSDFKKVNVFTPNDDNVNDTFFPFSSDFSKSEIAAVTESYKLYIYNRWGTLLFETDRILNEWDGRTSSGLSVAEGTYFWIAKVVNSCENSSTKTFNGFVQLAR